MTPDILHWLGSGGPWLAWRDALALLCDTGASLGKLLIEGDLHLLNVVAELDGWAQLQVEVILNSR